ncbi:MAG: hypothetical protein K2N33_04205 [Clostridia bacterium]|nr:hypothetical protein [Clostridia bacterium]MDE7306572.1 hypothetical protein [Clostridia bacterium]
MENNENKNTFVYNYAAPTESERKEIEDIRKNYIAVAQKEEKIDKLKKLDRRVNRPAAAAGYIIGVAGLLLFGFGMALSLEWHSMVWGCIASLCGVAVMVLAYFIYKLILSRNKEKYGKEILKLTEELLNENKDEQ